jgi:hypothetical protein
MEAFCDWLDVTYAPDDCPFPDLNQLLLALEFRVTRNTAGSTLYLPPSPARGALTIEHRSRYARISASGGVCSHLRAIGSWEEYLHILGTAPHKVTRCDASLDLPTDGADAIALIQSRYPDGTATLTRKTLKIDYWTAVRPDGRYTGTATLGYRSTARFKAKIYDKAWEALQKRGETLPPTTRFEMTACKDAGATLRDAAMPEALFWHIASPALFQTPPEGTPVWEPNADYHYTAKPRTFDPAETMRRRVEDSAELEAFVMLADSLGNGGRDYLLGLIRKKLDRSTDTSASDAA